MDFQNVFVIRIVDAVPQLRCIQNPRDFGSWRALPRRHRSFGNGTAEVSSFENGTAEIGSLENGCQDEII